MPFKKVPTENTRKIHFHIGPSHVYEGAFQRIFAPLSSQENFAFVEGEVYKEKVRFSVDGGDHEAVSTSLSKLCPRARTIAISRPRIFSAGQPMNQTSPIGLYKLETIQKAFPNDEIIFHLFLTDHLGYLCRFFNSKTTPIENRQFSWLELANSIREKIHEGNRLAIWRAEGKTFLKALISAMIDMPEQQRDAIASKIWNSENLPAPGAEERFAVESGLDIGSLDAKFESDMKTLIL